MLVKAIVKYDGSHYYGWQVQNGKRKFKTVEDVVNRAVSIINKRPTEVVASGRTDRGVHALAQVFHFENDHLIPEKRLVNALNNALPSDIQILDVKVVAADFHARFSAVSKEYHYYLNSGEYDLFQKDYITQYNKPLNYQVMLEAAQMLVGTHDFHAFNTTPKSQKMNQVRTLTKVSIVKKDNLYIFKIEGNSFLRHMVRMIVGMIVYIGAAKYSLKDLEILLKNKNSKKAPFNIEPNGLYLIKVNY
ncbi:MAG: tRNA pseudouridine(38-40) synthase TruA [Erysipelothrix sp.]|nr:tRNA pseudouridine(38-40) synthase TruA [Erysipelothrix sp.]